MLEAYDRMSRLRTVTARVVLVIAAMSVLLAAADGASAALTTKLYVTSSETIVNPERGFFHQPDKCGGARTRGEPLPQVDQEHLKQYRAEPEQISLVRCVFYLDTSPQVHQDQLTRFAEQALAARGAGVKMVVRFAYAKTPADVAPSVVQAHLGDLTDTLRDNSDVMLLVESGFVGSYGEGAFSQNFGNLLIGATPTAAQLAARKAVVDKLLAILPTTRKVVVRTPRMKRMMYGNEAPAPADPAAPAKARRVGHLNDCFLNGDSDGGTYRADEPDLPAMRTYPPPNDRTFVAQDTQLLPMGGETCGQAAPPRGQCVTAVPEMEKYHWSYLNRDWGTWIFPTWKNNCMEKIQQRLGYRFSLVSSKSTPTVRRGSSLPFQILVRNTGMAGTINRRRVLLALVKTTPPKTRYSFSLGTTADWQAATTRLRACMVPVPAGLSLGTYRMYLSLPDPEPTLNTASNKKLFSIQFANVGVWNAQAGLNDPQAGLNDLLRTVNVLPAAAAGRSGPGASQAAPACTSQPGP